MANEFLDDAVARLTREMRSLGISAEVAVMVAAEWRRGTERDWGGDRPYIAKTGEAAQAVLSRRNAALLRDWQAGERPAALARKYKISRVRVWQIVSAC